MLLEGKTVLITGASHGIGRGAALECARQGANVAINYHSADDDANAVVAAIEAMGRRALAVKGDVADPGEAPRFINAAVEAFGGIDVFVNNAGICPFHAFLDMPAELFERVQRVNMHGAFYMVQAAANRMKDQGRGGSIIVVSSISALVGGEFQTHYTPTKAGLLSLMNSTAIALGKYGIRCNSLLPGTIATEINKDDLSDPKKREYMETRIPLGRLGDPEDLGGPVVFFASDMSRYCTGSALLVDGGLFVNLQ
jgi:L-rhamnose 1-dehydrogenase